MLRAHDFSLMLLWMLCTGLVLFGFVVCVDRGLLQAMVDADRSGICVIVLVLYLVGLGHSCHRTLYLARELRNLHGMEQALRLRPTRFAEDSASADAALLTAGFMGDYLADLRMAMKGSATQERDPAANLLDAYALRLQRPHEFGWFLIDGMLKVGFLGTLVGFILMLGSISGSETLDASMLQQVLQKMSYGMSTALNTTLVSLVAAIFLSIPYYLLDRALEELLETTQRISAVYLLPHLQ